jgi:dipeptidyl-peptidase 4
MFFRTTKGCLMAFFFLTMAMTKAQTTKKSVSLEDVFERNLFAPKTVQSVNWMKDGAFYTAWKEGKVQKFKITDGSLVETLFDENVITPRLKVDEYFLSADESKILLATDREAIYRRSSKANFYVYDLKTKALQLLSKDGKQSNATFSPDGSKVAFCRDNNLFYVNLNNMEELKFSFDGKINEVINGSTDWVYEEEWGFAKAFWWSPDSKKIAYLRTDERNVREYNMQKWGELYPKDYRFKYPKAGEVNSVVKVVVFDVAKDSFLQMDTGSETDVYLPRVEWTTTPDVLSIWKVNRLQNQMILLHANTQTGKVESIINETATTYVDLEYTDDLYYLADGKGFIHSSEKSGYKHLYLHDISGKELRAITSGDWEVTSLVGIDEKNQSIYYLSTENSALERQLYVIGFDGKNKKALTQDKGTVLVSMSPDFKYFVRYHSSVQRPMQVDLCSLPTGKSFKKLENNQALSTTLSGYNIQTKDFFSFKTTDGNTLNGWMIKPSNFDAKKKYPVIQFVYGGPGSQMVTDVWADSYFYMYQILAEKGYIIACVDGRGTGARGRAFKHVTYANLGKYEVNDQIETARYLGSLGYIDKARIGIWGWSYGGYMASLCMMLGNDVFKAGVAGAPVTSWRYYDTIYTERYLQTPQLNAKGYDDFSPISHVDKLKGNFLLIHGTGDDNVHFQNSIMLQDALIKAGKQFQTFIYPNQPHGLVGAKNRMHLQKLMIGFWEKNL